MNRKTKSITGFINLSQISVILFLLLLPSPHSYGNNLSDYAAKTNFTICMQNITMKTIIDYIEQKSEFIFVYSESFLNTNQVVNVDVSNKTVFEILDQIKEQTDIVYTVNDRQIVLSVEEKKETAQQPSIKITGTVLDETGETIIGANVLIKGTTTGTSTDVNGKFSINVPSKNARLVVSYIGYISQEIILDGGNDIVVTLTPDTEVLSEVVVVGFGKQKKESVVGAIQTVKASELRVPGSSLSNSFAGRIAGMISVQRSGEPGADGSNFWIRGIATFAGATDPLIFVDNVEVSMKDMNALAPEVIEGFSVLKDATATALYGARGANGVILITTRQGSNMEKARINIRVENSFTQPTKIVKIADGVDYMIARNNAVLNRTPDAKPYYTQEEIDNTRNNVNPYIYPNVDWQDYLFKDFASTQTANLNVTGGGSKVVYFMSATINNDTGMLKKAKENSFNNNINQLKISLQGNIGAELTKTTKATLRINTNIVNYTGSAVSTGDIYRGIFEAPGVMFQPTLPAQNNEDHILFGNKNGGPVAGRYLNPYASMVSGYSNRSESTVTASFELEQDLKFITPGLRATGIISFKNWSKTNIVRDFTPFYYGITDFEKDPEGNYTYNYEAISKGTTSLATSTTNEGDRLTNLQFSLDYSRRFGKHDVGGLIVYMQRDYNLNSPGNFYETLPERNQGFAGRVTYGYDYRYLIEANFGYNGSETFEEGKRFGFFPSVAIGYNISNEEFFEPLIDVVSNLKLRASWGKVGNSALTGGSHREQLNNRFPYLTFVNLAGGGYTFGQNWQTTQSGAIITRYGAAGTSWETGTKNNIGFDLGLFNNAVNITADFFRETRDNIFMRRVVIPAESGITGNLRPFANLGKMKNKGVDISLDVNKVINKDFIIGVKGSFTYAKNIVVNRDEPEYDFDYLYDAGKPHNRYRGLVAIGLFESQEDIDNSPVQTFSPNLKPGDIKYEDLNGDGKIDDLDRKQLGHPTVPQIVYGFGASAQYKNFDFSFFFQGVAQTSLMMEGFHPFTSDQTTLLDFIAKDYWTEENPNPNAKYPRLISNLDDHNNFRRSTFWLRDGSFLRLKNVEIGYSYKMARIYLAGQNLLTFAPFKHWDPELGGGRGLSYPNLRMASVGVQLTF